MHHSVLCRLSHVFVGLMRACCGRSSAPLAPSEAAATSSLRHQGGGRARHACVLGRRCRRPCHVRGPPCLWPLVLEEVGGANEEGDGMDLAGGLEGRPLAQRTAPTATTLRRWLSSSSPRTCLTTDNGGVRHHLEALSLARTPPPRTPSEYGGRPQPKAKGRPPQSVQLSRQLQAPWWLARTEKESKDETTELPMSTPKTAATGSSRPNSLQATDRLAGRLGGARQPTVPEATLW